MFQSTAELCPSWIDPSPFNFALVLYTVFSCPKDPSILKYYDDSKNNKLLRRSVFTMPPIFIMPWTLLWGKMSVIPRKMVSKSQCDSKFTTRSLFSTAGSFGCHSDKLSVCANLVHYRGHLDFGSLGPRGPKSSKRSWYESRTTIFKLL